MKTEHQLRLKDTNCPLPQSVEYSLTNKIQSETCVKDVFRRQLALEPTRKIQRPFNFFPAALELQRRVFKRVYLFLEFGMHVVDIRPVYFDYTR